MLESSDSGVLRRRNAAFVLMAFCAFSTLPADSLRARGEDKLPSKDDHTGEVHLLKRTQSGTTWLIPVIVGDRHSAKGDGRINNATTASPRKYELVQLEEARPTSSILFNSREWGEVTRYFGDDQSLRLLTKQYLEEHLQIEDNLATLLVKERTTQQLDETTVGANGIEMKEKTPPELVVSFVSPAFRKGDLHWTEVDIDRLLSFCLRESGSDAKHQFVFGDWAGMRLAARYQGTSQRERTDLDQILLISQGERKLRRGDGLEMPFLIVPRRPDSQSTMIVQYAEPLFKEQWNKEEGRRLVIDISSLPVDERGSPWGSRQRLLEAAFNLPEKRKVEEVSLELFNRLKKLSLDATKRHQVGGHIVIENPFKDAELERQESIFALSESEYITHYFNRSPDAAIDPDRVKELKAPFPMQWIKTAVFSGRFDKVPKQTRNVGHFSLPLTLRHKDLSDAKFHLVVQGEDNADNAYFVQDFEVKVSHWRKFLNSATGDAFLTARPVNEETVREIFGNKWQKGDRMQTYLAAAAKHRWQRNDEAKEALNTKTPKGPPEVVKSNETGRGESASPPPNAPIDPLEVNRHELPSVKTLLTTFFESNGDDLPMCYVDRPAIDAFCNWVNGEPHLPDGQVWIAKLPTAKEAGWLKQQSNRGVSKVDKPLQFKEALEKAQDYWYLDDARKIVGLRGNVLEIVKEGKPSGELWNGLAADVLCDKEHFDQFTGFRLIVRRKESATVNGVSTEAESNVPN